MVRRRVSIKDSFQGIKSPLLGNLENLFSRISKIHLFIVLNDDASV